MCSGVFRRSLAMAATITCILAFSSTPALAIPLTDLLGGGSITVDDKLFDNFDLERNSGSIIVDTDRIEVTGLNDQPNNPGLKFTATSDGLTVNEGNFIDFAFNFKVTVLDPNKRIKDASIALTDFVGDPISDGFIEIDDFVFDPGFIGLGSMFVTSDPFFGGTNSAIEFAPQSMLFQEIDIYIESFGSSDPVGISMFEVRKSQIPSPAPLALIGFGVAGLAFIKRQKKEGS